MNKQVLETAIKALKYLREARTTKEAAYFDRQDCACFNGAIAMKLKCTRTEKYKYEQRKQRYMKLKEYGELIPADIIERLTMFHLKYALDNKSFKEMKQEAIEYLERRKDV